MRNRCLIIAAALCLVSWIALASGTDKPGANANGSKDVITDPTNHIDRSIFINIPDKFKTLKRAPVLFPHDKHTDELKKEGCEACHPKKDGKFVFTYPATLDIHDRDAFMNSFHDGCIKCHSDRKKAGKKGGPVTCGECHSDKIAYRPEKYLPKLPEYYSAMRDTYHKNCIACHQSPAKSAEDAKGLDWKNFYVKEKERIAVEFPKVFFDYYLHDKHDKALEKKCANCHYISPELKKKLDAEGKQPTSQDWLREVEKGGSLVIGDEAHARCINCHLKLASENKKAGPTFCKDCHTGIERTAEQMKDIPRQECEEKYNRSFLIKLKTGEGKMPDVAFDHKAHQARSRGCQECHHSTLEACGKCHTEKGDAAGKFITLPEAFHEPASGWSCVGCHEKQKQKPDCAGCHSLRPAGLTQSACTSCHSGSLATITDAAKKPAPETLFPEKLKDQLEAGALAWEYEPSKFKHKDIAKALTDISNKSSLATYFHKNEMTICMGCHHMGPVEKGKPVAPCRTCHTARKEPGKSTPTLLGAYHQSCLGCHQKMNRPEDKMPQKCEGCHKEVKISQNIAPEKNTQTDAIAL